MTRWQELSPRERHAVLGGSAAVLLVIAWLAVEPVLEAHRRYTAELPALRADLAWMEARVPVVAALRAARPPTGQTVARVRAAAGELGANLPPDAVSPRGEAGARVVVEDLAFATLVQLLAILEQRDGLVVATLEVARKPEHPGQVSAAFDLAVKHAP